MQRRRKNAVVVSVLLPVELIRLIDARVAYLNGVSKSPPRSRSEWMKRAIKRDLEHDQRSRKRYAVQTKKVPVALGHLPKSMEPATGTPALTPALSHQGIGLQPPVPAGAIDSVSA